MSKDLGFGALLVRPDGVVAWTSDHDPGSEALGRAAKRWFGEPES
nr:hypothetical protein [Amycolatopsis eburnea]